MVIKISTGRLKGRTIGSTNSARELRPTSSKTRTALINTLFSGALLEFDEGESIALDLYAGIGTVGFELLSNGIDHVIFVEKDNRCSKIIQENIRHLKLETNASLLNKPVHAALKQFTNNEKSKNNSTNFDLIFADPPYKDSEQAFKTIIKEILENSLLKPRGLFVFESGGYSPLKSSQEAAFGSLVLVKEKSYGDTCFFIWQNMHEN